VLTPLKLTSILSFGIPAMKPPPNPTVPSWPQYKLDRVAMVGSVAILFGSVSGLVAFANRGGYQFRERDLFGIIFDVIIVAVWIGFLVSHQRYRLPIIAMLALSTGDLLVSIASHLPAELHTPIRFTVAALMLLSAISCGLYLARWLPGRRTGEARS
jgi:hypothetical protein